MLLGSLALIGFPGFAGFFSKDAIIEAVHHSTIPGSGYAYAMVLAGVFVTAFYSFRMFFLVFHGKERMDAHTREHLKESPAVVTIPLVLLAIPSVVIGAMAIELLLFGDFFQGSIHVAAAHDTLAEVGKGYHGAVAFVVHGMQGPTVYLALAGLLAAWYIYLLNPALADWFRARLDPVYEMLDKKYWFDEAYQFLFASGSRGIGKMFWKGGDVRVIDGIVVDGSAHTVGWFAGVVRNIQSGFLYHYAIAMILGLLVLLIWYLN